MLAAASVCWLTPSPSVGQSQKPQVLFVQAAGGVTFKDGVLTLKDVAPTTTFFSDRPKHITGIVRNDEFIKGWSEGKNSFKSDPPNAALAIFDSTGRPSQTIVVLTNPRLEGKDLSYNAKSLRGEIPAEGAASTLFIDGSGVPCGEDVNYAGYPCWAQSAFTQRGW